MTQFFYGSSPAAYSNGALLDTTKIYDNGLIWRNKNDYQVFNMGVQVTIPGRMRNRYTVNGKQ